MHTFLRNIGMFWWFLLSFNEHFVKYIKIVSFILPSNFLGLKNVHKVPTGIIQILIKNAKYRVISFFENLAICHAYFLASVLADAVFCAQGPQKRTEEKDGE